VYRVKDAERGRAPRSHPARVAQAAAGPEWMDAEMQDFLRRWDTAGAGDGAEGGAGGAEGGAGGGVTEAAAAAGGLGLSEGAGATAEDEAAGGGGDRLKGFEQARSSSPCVVRRVFASRQVNFRSTRPPSLLRRKRLSPPRSRLCFLTSASGAVGGVDGDPRRAHREAPLVHRRGECHSLHLFSLMLSIIISQSEHKTHFSGRAPLRGAHPARPPHNRVRAPAREQCARHAPLGGSGASGRGARRGVVTFLREGRRGTVSRRGGVFGR
jgi:hypothetical protein